MSKKFDAVCIGLAVQDILLTGVRSDALSRDTTYANDCLVTSGGDANNQAITLGRLGDKVAPVFCISCDPIGESVYTALRNEPLNLSFIIRKPDAQMALSVVVVDPDGNRSFICRRGNKAFYLGREDIHDDMLSNTKIVTIGSLYSLPGLDGPPVADILKCARESGAVTVCDMTADMNHIGPEGEKKVFPFIDYLIPSLEEGIYTTNETNPEKIADAFLAMGVRNVAVKLGKGGSFFKNRKEKFYCESYPVKAVDTTGCGDCFTGGFTHGLIKGLSHRDCMKFGNACGAINATHLGAHHAIVDEKQVLEFMSTHKNV